MDALEQIFAANAMHDQILHLVSEEAIRERAYEIYERRGRLHGRAEEDWFEAESELHNEAHRQQQSWT